MKIIGIALYTIVQILSIPLAIVGIVLVAYKQMVVSRRLGVSSTAIEVINGRWTMDVFGIREDAATIKLNRVLPNNSLPGMWLALFPLYFLYRMTGENIFYPKVAQPGEEGIADLVISRTRYFDDIIDLSKDKVDQLVVMGAGFDTRCYGDLVEGNLKCFELDQNKTQQLKIEALGAAGIDARHVSFVEVDFASERWYEKLQSAGYDRNRKTIFLWEGVTLYLSRSDVCKTIEEIAEYSAEGSVVVADFYSESFISGDYAPGMKTGIKSLKLTDEELGFGLEFSADHERVLKNFLESQHMTVGKTCFMGANKKKGPFMVVVEFLT